MSDNQLSRRHFLGAAGASVVSLLTPQLSALLKLRGVRADGVIPRVQLHTFDPSETPTVDAVQLSLIHI